MKVHVGLDHGPGVGGLQFPRVPSLAVYQTRVIVALVEVFEHRREDLGGLVGKSDALGGRLGVVPQNVSEVGSPGEDILVSGKYALFVTDDEGDDGADAAASGKMSD